METKKRRLNDSSEFLLFTTFLQISLLRSFECGEGRANKGERLNLAAFKSKVKP
jgi:hypothetical protein